MEHLLWKAIWWVLKQLNVNQHTIQQFHVQEPTQNSEQELCYLYTSSQSSMIHSNQNMEIAVKR